MIKRIKIRDFKSIREIDLELDPVTVLVGRSGTGKSNVVQAIRFLRNLLLEPQQAVAFEFGWESRGRGRLLKFGSPFRAKTMITVTKSFTARLDNHNFRVRLF
jgi:predicted ATPase